MISNSPSSISSSVSLALEFREHSGQLRVLREFLRQLVNNSLTGIPGRERSCLPGLRKLLPDRIDLGRGHRRDHELVACERCEGIGADHFAALSRIDDRVVFDKGLRAFFVSEGLVRVDAFRIDLPGSA